MADGVAVSNQRIRRNYESWRYLNASRREYDAQVERRRFWFAVARIAPYVALVVAALVLVAMLAGWIHV